MNFFIILGSLPPVGLAKKYSAHLDQKSALVLTLILVAFLLAYVVNGIVTYRKLLKKYGGMAPGRREVRDFLKSKN